MSPEVREPDEGGIVVRGADGTLFFLRDSLLEECRLPKDLARQAERLLDNPDIDKRNFAVKEAVKLEAVGRVEGQVGEAGKGFRANMAAMSTVMCPSFLFEPGGPIKE
jgi:hypothetical protein